MGPWRSAFRNLKQVDLGTAGGVVLGAVGAGVSAVLASPEAQQAVAGAVTQLATGSPWGWAAVAFLGGMASFVGGMRAAQPKQDP